VRPSRLLRLLVLTSSVSAGDEQRASPARAADAVLAATKGKDEAALAALAAKDDPDPWIVADELLGRREPDAALSFARASSRKAVGRLEDYVAASTGVPENAALREAVASAFSALEARRSQAALDAVAPFAVPGDCVLAVRLGWSRGYALRSLHRLEESARAFRESAEVAERLGWTAGVMEGLGEAGLSAVARSDFAAAIVAWEESLRIAEDRSDRNAIARYVGNLGNVYYSRGDLIRSLDFQERALRMHEEAGDASGVARIVGNIGGVLHAMGNFDRALEYQQRALRLREEAGDRAGMASTLGNLGVVHASLGHYARALEYFERALAAAEALGDPSRTAKTLGSLGLLYAEIRDYESALDFHRRALALRERIGDRAGAAQSLGNIGIVRAKLGETAQAAQDQERALKIKEEIGDRVGMAATLGNLGNLHKRAGDFPKALDCFQRALALSEASKDRVGAAKLTASVGMLHLDAGEVAKALPLLERAAREAERLRATPVLIAALASVAAARLAGGDAGRALADAKRGVALIESVLGGLGDDEGSLAREEFTDLFAIGAAAAARLGEPAEVAFFLESGRAGSLLESLGGRQALRWQSLPEELRRAETEAKAAAASALAEYTRALDRGDRADIRAKDQVLDAARERLASVVERIQRDAKREAGVFYPHAATLEEIEGWLAEGDTLVSYAFVGRRVLALVVTGDAARVVDLGPAGAVTAACEAVPWTRPAEDPTRGIDALKALLVTPLGLGDEAKRVIVSPEGPLSYVAFAPLLGGHDVALVHSGTTYGLLAEERAPKGEGILALGDPDYAGRAATPAGDVSGRRVLSALPGTREEALAIGTVTLLGKEASPAGLLAALGRKEGRWRSVHLACHGLVSPEAPMFSGLALSPDAESTGFLGAHAVLRMNVATDLVVLSACETGKGRIVKGEGIVGLTRAFMFAGAPRVIVSLWKVDDDATRALMKKFYERWKAGTPTARALREAQEFVRSEPKWAHPYHWAAWVLWGLPD